MAGHSRYGASTAIVTVAVSTTSGSTAPMSGRSVWSVKRTVAVAVPLRSLISTDSGLSPTAQPGLAEHHGGGVDHDDRHQPAQGFHG